MCCRNTYIWALLNKAAELRYATFRKCRTTLLYLDDQRDDGNELTQFCYLQTAYLCINFAKLYSRLLCIFS